jgi:hypothetical protein
MIPEGREIPDACCPIEFTPSLDAKSNLNFQHCEAAAESQEI